MAWYIVSLEHVSQAFYDDGSFAARANAKREGESNRAVFDSAKSFPGGVRLRKRQGADRTEVVEMAHFVRSKPDRALADQSQHRR